jgi:hypothetical protein
MAENNNTAERELLKAIEGKTTPRPIGHSPIAGMKDGVLSIAGNVSSYISYDKVKSKITLHNTNILFVVLIVFFVTWWFIVMGKGFMRMDDIKNIGNIDVKISDRPVIMPEFGLKEYANYLDALLGRNIFNPVKTQVPSSDGGLTSEANKAGNLKLVGISWDEERNDRYAMVEDVQTNLTYYVKEGDFVLEFLVKEISERQIVLSHQNNDIRLQ